LCLPILCGKPKPLTIWFSLGHQVFSMEALINPVLIPGGGWA
jgi:hypothetical protein